MRLRCKRSCPRAATKLIDTEKTIGETVRGRLARATCLLLICYYGIMNFPVEVGHKFPVIAKEIKFNPEDVEEHFTRGSGHGGQSVNKSTNCVELRHEPTGIDVRYQHHRGLLRNRKEAWELLVIKVEEHVKGKQSEIGQKRHKIQKQKQRRSRKAKEKMLDEKKKRSEIKEFRRAIDNE